MATTQPGEHPEGSATHEADPLEQGTPAGKVADLIEEAEETGATTDADALDESDAHDGPAAPGGR